MDRVILGLLVLFLALAVSEATTCYSCSTHTEDICSDDHFDKYSVDTEECTATGACSKIKGSNFTMRACAAIHLDEGCNTTKGIEECVCKADLCNDNNLKSPNTATNVASMTSMVIVVCANIAFRFM